MYTIERIKFIIRMHKQEERIKKKPLKISNKQIGCIFALAKSEKLPFVKISELSINGLEEIKNKYNEIINKRIKQRNKIELEKLNEQVRFEETQAKEIQKIPLSYEEYKKKAERREIINNLIFNKK